LKQLETSSELSPRGLKKLDDLRGIAQQIGREIHELALALRPTALDDLGLLGALTNYLEGWSASTGLELDLHSSGLDGERLPSHVETTVYRVAQEALNNVVKHADARNVSVTLERRHDQLVVVIEDDGVGFSTAVPAQTSGPKRLGLSGMRERVALVDGNLTVESEPGKGTAVILRVPAEKLRSD
jgi:signal transduction histidine kinase